MVKFSKEKTPILGNVLSNVISALEDIEFILNPKDSSKIRQVYLTHISDYNKNNKFFCDVTSE